MNFSAYSIRNPIPAILLFILLSVAGLLSYKNLKVQDFPDVELPLVTVVANLPGAAPAQLETEVARKIEDGISNISLLKNTYTTITDGMVHVVAEFELEKDNTEAMNEVRDAVSTVRADLPSEMEAPIISKMGTSGRTIVSYIVTPKAAISKEPMPKAVVSNSAISEGEPAKITTPKTATQTANNPSISKLSPQIAEELSWFVDNTVKKRLLGVEGVGAVKRMGGADRQIEVILDPEQANALGVTAQQVSQTIRAVQQEKPGGRGDIAGAEQAIRTIATLGSAAELEKLVIPLGAGRMVTLGEIARVSDSTTEKRSLATYNGKEVVAFEIFRTKGASEIGVEQASKEAMDKLAAEYPQYEITQVINNATPVDDNFTASMHLLYEGALLAILVVWLFLKDWRAMLVAATALPLSILPTFLGLKLFGYSLNTVTLLAMALVVGVLVDDAIVEIENIERHMQMGKKPFKAAMEAADEIGMAVIATTMALIAVFLPTAFMGGVPGLFFKQFGWTAVIAIFSSLVVARLLTPMMAAYFLKPKASHHKVQKDGMVMRWYLKLVKWCLHNRVAVVLAAIGFFASSLWLAKLLPTGFVPAADRAQTLVNIELQPGSTLEETQRISAIARAKILDVPEVVSVLSSIGGGSSGDAFAMGTIAAPTKSVLTITTTERDERSTSLRAIEDNIRSVVNAIPGARFKVGLADSGTKLQLVLQSEDAAALTKTAQAAMRDLRTLKGIGNVSSNAALVRPEVIVRPDFSKAGEAGVTTQAIADTVRVATAGDYELALAKLNVSERQIPIQVKLPDTMRSDLSKIEALEVPANFGTVPLSSVAHIYLDSGPAQIDRLNRMRNITIDVELAQRSLGEVQAEAMALPTFKNLPPSVSLAELGDAAEMKKLFASFGTAMAIGVFCIFAVLVLLFKDFLQPITVLVALPLSVGGAMIALLLTGKALSMPTMIGLIMLMGIVTKNSILLIDYVVIARGRGMSRFEALVDACHKRARPIIMTTIAMGAGMMPLALGLNGDPSFRAPMAITVIGGLVTSTALSLIVVPVFYTLIDGLQRRTKSLMRRAEAQG